MTTEQIVDTALENLLKTTGFQGEWKSKWAGKKPIQTGRQLDGILLLRADQNVLQFNTEVKDELRTLLLPQIFESNDLFDHFLMITTRIPSKIKKELRANGINYLEANGNLYVKTSSNWFWIEVNEPLKVERNVKNRAFTKTGLRVLFEFLSNHALINQPYRQIAEQTGASIGTITHIVNGLKQEGFLISVSQNEYQFQQLDKLLGRWIVSYQRILKPALQMGRFRFLEKEDFSHWQYLNLNVPKTLWGGEAAGGLLTGFLKPAELTLYTNESRSQIINKYRLIPDEAGNVLVYKKFWQHQKFNQPTVPPLLVYADLINKHDRRCTETAQKVYEEYIQPELQ